MPSGSCPDPETHQIAVRYSVKCPACGAKFGPLPGPRDRVLLGIGYGLVGTMAILSTVVVALTIVLAVKISAAAGIIAGAFALLIALKFLPKL